MTTPTAKTMLELADDIERVVNRAGVEWHYAPLLMRAVRALRPIKSPESGLRECPNCGTRHLCSMEFFITPAPSVGVDAPRWRHKKRGTTYVEIGRGLLQTMDSGGLTDNEPMVIYRNEETGTLWVRDQVEFEDGRFEFLPPSHAALTPSRQSGAGEVKPFLWICIVPGEWEPEKIRVWTRDPDQAARLVAKGMDMKPLYAVPLPTTDTAEGGT